MEKRFENLKFISGLSTLILILLRQNASIREELRSLKKKLDADESLLAPTAASTPCQTPTPTLDWKIDPFKDFIAYDEFVEELKNATSYRNYVSGEIEFLRLHVMFVYCSKLVRK